MTVDNKEARPVIVIPMGDPNGIGPEIVLKAMAEPAVFTWCRPLVVGDLAVLKRFQATVPNTVAPGSAAPNVTIRTVKDVAEVSDQPGVLSLIDLATPGLEALETGTVQALAGACAMAYIRQAVALAADGRVQAMATTPINKESLRAAQVPHIGHTEILADLTGSEDPLTLFETGGLRVFFHSRHVSLRQACDLITRDKVLRSIRRCVAALRQLGVQEGTLAVAGLNPHSGEHGLFGDEEVVAVTPAVEDARAEGLDVVGPIGADSVFHQAKTGRYAAVLSLYHDQGHIATKTLDFERTISLTLGLPFLRTSVDHGTALDIAGQGIASPVSMIEAIRLAAHYGPLYRAGA